MNDYKKEQITGEQAVKFENWMQTGAKEVSPKLHDGIDIPEEEFMVHIWEKGDTIEYAYQNSRKSWYNDSVRSEWEVLVGFSSIDEVLDRFEEIDFEEV